MLRNIIAQLKQIISFEAFLAITLHIPSSAYNNWSYFDYCFFCKYLIKTLEKQKKEQEMEMERTRQQQKLKNKSFK
jgi:hypothetical protein